MNAAPVHLFGGVWGLLAAGIFSSKFSYSAAYFDGDRSDKCAGILYGGSGRSLAANSVFLLSVVAWVGLTTLVLFVVTKLTIGIRVSKQQELAGMYVFVVVVVAVFFSFSFSPPTLLYCLFAPFLSSLSSLRVGCTGVMKLLVLVDVLTNRFSTPRCWLVQPAGDSLTSEVFFHC